VPKEELAEVLLTLSLQFHTHGCFQMCPGREMTHAKKMMTIGGILNTLCLLMQDGQDPHGLGHHRPKWIAMWLLNRPYNMYSVSIAAAPEFIWEAYESSNPSTTVAALTDPPWSRNQESATTPIDQWNKRIEIPQRHEPLKEIWIKHNFKLVIRVLCLLL